MIGPRRDCAAQVSDGVRVAATRQSERAQVELRSEVPRILFQAMEHDGFLQLRAAVLDAARQNLQPEVSHLVGGLVPAAHVSRRLIGIARIRGRIIVMVAHGNHGSLRQEYGFFVAVDGLPIRVPIRNADEPLALPTGQRRIAFQQAAQVVRDTMSVMRWGRCGSRRRPSGGNSASSIMWAPPPCHNFSDSTARPTTQARSESIPNSWRLWSGRNGPATGGSACPKS